MEKNKRTLEEADLPVVEFESKLTQKVIHCKHGSKHMSFNTKGYGAAEVVEREDGVAYDPKNSTFYQSDRFKR